MVSLSRTHIGVALAAVLSALAFCLAASPSAQADIYWSTLGAGDTGSTIGRANHDGSGVNPNFILSASGPCGIGLNSTHLYWANSNNNNIGRANLDGSSADNAFLDFPSGGYCGVGLSGSHVFWGSNGNIGRAGLDGSSPNTSFISAPNDCGVAVFGDRVYWGNTGLPGIARANTNGGDITPNFISVPSTFPCVGLATASSVYWDYGATIARANVDGSGVATSFITSEANGCNMATDGVYLYWTTDASIGRANLDGSSANPNFISGLTRPCGVAATPLPVTPVPPADPAPTVVVKGKKARRGGSIKLTVEVSGAGKIVAAQVPSAKRKAGSRGLTKKASRTAAAAGRVTLLMKPTSAAKKLLKKGKRVRVKVLVTYTAASGAKATAKTKLMFKPEGTKR